MSAALDKILLVPVKDDARTFDNNLKWLFTAIVSLASAVAPLGSAMLMRKIVAAVPFLIE